MESMFTSQAKTLFINFLIQIYGKTTFVKKKENFIVERNLEVKRISVPFSSSKWAS